MKMPLMITLLFSVLVIIVSSHPICGQQDSPSWPVSREMSILDKPLSDIRPDLVVSKDGRNGSYPTIAAAIEAAPDLSSERTVIYVAAGTYEEEQLEVGKKKTNLVFVGDGIGKTVITGSKSFDRDHLTTYHTASFAVSGNGFMARDITFENTAGPQNHQAVALRIGSNQSVVYRCSILGYQDTLYVHRHRQFFRECDIYGTVDFIFGDAAVVFQNCNIYARKPMNGQPIVITAQNRFKDEKEKTGIVFHNSSLLVAADLEPYIHDFHTFLGRPWDLFSTVVYMQCQMGGHVDPLGWTPWKEGDTRAFGTVYYGEFENHGLGAVTGGRVNWTGFHNITLRGEAEQFTVDRFISGSSWLTSTGVPFVGGLLPSD